MKKLRLKGSKPPKLCCPKCRVRQKPVWEQLDFWTLGDFIYHEGRMSLYVLSEKADESASKQKEL